MTIKNAERVIKHDQHCTQPLLSQKKGILLGGMDASVSNLADTRGAHSRG